MPALTGSVVVPDSDPPPGFDSMLTDTDTGPVAAELVMSCPAASSRATLTGPPWESKPAATFAPTVVPAGSPSLVKASEQVPASEPDRWGALAGSSWKSLP